ncbi:MAG TPA: hypothetical protein VGR55_06980 [Candidatus Acidoferrum sp.]|nr:hypothetical protein [Candidatus Acidoferrum sp.]
MMQRFVRISFVFILIAALVFPPAPTLACGPDFTLPTYTDFHVPDSRNLSYERGQLGVLQRGYYHVYLYEAYRNLSGEPFSESELKALRDWQPGDGQQPQSQNASGQKAQDWIGPWREINTKALGLPRNRREPYSDSAGIVRMEFRDQLFHSYYNCLQDAFQNGVRIANEREKQFGADNPVYKEWIVAQDQVFENCAGEQSYPPKPKPAVIPAAARAEDPQIIRADRAYQIAAAHFYSGDFNAAKAEFEQIANDPSSPYRGIAPYLVARALVRKATLTETADQFDPEAMAQAEKQLLTILADKNSAEFHPAAKRLLGFVRIRLHPEERLRDLEAVVLGAKPTPNWSQDLTDYLWLLDHPFTDSKSAIPVSPQPNGIVVQSEHPVPNAARIKGSDLTDWIFTYQESGQAAFQHSFQRWHETKSLPWLVASMMKANPKDAASVAELTAAASKIGPDWPAFLTLTFHHLRLLEQSGQADQARRELDALLTQRAAAMPISARNEFRALRMKLAVNLSELLQFAPRLSVDAAGVAPLPAGQADYKPGSPEYAATRPHFDSDASVVLAEKLPPRLLAEAAKSNLLSQDLRRDVVIAAWTRAILLKNEAVARELTPALGELVPEVKAALAEYASAPDAQQREFAAVFAFLRNPGFRPFVSADPGRGWFYSFTEKSGFDEIDNFHDNWWCSMAPPPKDQNWGWNYYRMFAQLRDSLKEVYPDGAVLEPGFLRNEEKSSANEEWAALVALPSAPRWLGQLTVAWANAHPDDPRVPEALHLVVRASRYGCTESTGENYSKQAFEFLHKHYPNSEWTKKTPYWFN